MIFNAILINFAWHLAESSPSRSFFTYRNSSYPAHALYTRWMVSAKLLRHRAVRHKCFVRLSTAACPDHRPPEN